MNPDNTDRTSLLEFINENVVGKDSTFQGPFGCRKIVYCDYTASAKPLRCIESYITDSVLPMYANTHTATCATALQMSYFRQESRDIVRSSVRASEHDAVIFTGNGATGAIHKLINTLNFDRPPIVFCGPYEHHSNLVPWREISAHVVRISEARNGVNLSHLEAVLKEYSKLGLPMVGCFSAASNITGQLCDTIAISVLLHKYKVLAFWDYATAAPYVNIDMHPYVEHGDASKDAIFISPHKFVGGVSTPGVLVAAKDILKNPVPSECGGGTVFFVTENGHKYLQDHEIREEGGTPDIVGSIRCGLCFKLKTDVGYEEIMKRENELFKSVTSAWSKSKNIEILGLPETDVTHERLAIFSFMIRHPESGLYLHYSFVAALLNDMFGIQARGGCACAGPYAQELLGISSENISEYERILTEDSRLDRRHLRRFKEYSRYEVLRPGFVRLSIPYFFDDETTNFIIESVLLVAESAWTMLPHYTFDPDTGEWRHVKQKISANREWLGRVTFNRNGSDVTKSNATSLSLRECLQEAKRLFEKASQNTNQNLPDHEMMFDGSVEHLKWFLTPSEAHCYVTKKRSPSIKLVANPVDVRKAIRELSAEEISQSSIIPSQLKNMSSNDTSFKGWKSQQSMKTQERKFETKNSNGTKIPAENIINGRPREPGSEVKSSTELNSQNTESVRMPLLKLGFVSPPKRLMKLSIQAIEDFGMIRNGDKVLVCLSGGKDSLSLLHTLRQYQFYARKNDISFELGAVTVDPRSSSYDPSPLKPYLSTLGLPYFFEEQGILDQALTLPEVTSICAFCSRMKRGRLYHCARREGWNVLAMGQHLDDLAESFLMSFFQNGLLRTMKANYTVKEGDLRVIRPLCYVREKDTRDFAESSRLPVIPENCPACFEAPKERHRMKQLLASLEVVHPKLFFSVKEALKPLMSVSRTGLKYPLNQDDVCGDNYD